VVDASTTVATVGERTTHTATAHSLAEGVFHPFVSDAKPER
jgi:hypothetical protein